MERGFDLQTLTQPWLLFPFSLAQAQLRDEASHVVDHEVRACLVSTSLGETEVGLEYMDLHG